MNATICQLPRSGIGLDVTTYRAVVRNTIYNFFSSWFSDFDPEISKTGLDIGHAHVACMPQNVPGLGHWLMAYLPKLVCLFSQADERILISIYFNIFQYISVFPCVAMAYSSAMISEFSIFCNDFFHHTTINSSKIFRGVQGRCPWIPLEAVPPGSLNKWEDLSPVLRRGKTFLEGLGKAHGHKMGKDGVGPPMDSVSFMKTFQKSTFCLFLIEETNIYQMLLVPWKKYCS